MANKKMWIVAIAILIILVLDDIKLFLVDKQSISSFLSSRVSSGKAIIGLIKK